MLGLEEIHFTFAFSLFCFPVFKSKFVQFIFSSQMTCANQNQDFFWTVLKKPRLFVSRTDSAHNLVRKKRAEITVNGKTLFSGLFQNKNV